jgi:Ca2+:H+ antiporter
LAWAWEGNYTILQCSQSSLRSLTLTLTHPPINICVESSLSAQTSFAIGAFLNATFGSMIEIILSMFAILDGGLNGLVQASVTGTILGMMLLLPGLSMLFGGIKYKEMHFNPASAGVSGVLLLLSIVGMVFHSIFSWGF